MTVAATVLGIVVLLPAAVLLAQVALALRGFPAAPERSSRPRLAVLVPAHQEATIIAATLRALGPQLAATDRLLVVADNCSDDTAALARQEGAWVVERHDPERRGKTYALEFGLRALEADPPQVVVVLDADCRVSGLDLLAESAQASGRPAQALYLMEAGARTRVAAFAWIVKNLARPLGMARAGLPCQLMGTGMAVPWRLAPLLASGGAALAEDVKAGIEMALAGAPPVFCPHARVTSAFPERAAAIASQRRRWEHGHLALILQETPRLLLAAARRRDARLAALALDLAVPPLSLLALLVAVALALGLAAGAPLPALAAAGALAAAVLLAWWRWGRDTVPLRTLLLGPAYAFCKIPLYLRFLLRREKAWVKTERETQ